MAKCWTIVDIFDYKCYCWGLDLHIKTIYHEKKNIFLNSNKQTNKQIQTSLNMSDDGFLSDYLVGFLITN